MVRVFIKGGVWKNSEDEILKAAVQKYGKQQWARVASLLNRKSAKQCKARWHEWLDPSVRKVEWSRPEEEKLLHLAKLMPAQWKTIAPLVGRTAAQCQEHYESLLDQAAGGGEGGEGGGARNFQPGQIDSHPETKPARPDPIDMDEDEIEMLQEARARLANTQGKKAKRKAREKMLAQAKRLADLQKRRELKQAGLLSSAARKKVKRKSRDIDLGVEIPFHKPAPAGFHDTSAEAARGEAIYRNRLKKVNFKQVNENQYRTRDREAAQAKKREQARLRALEKSNMQYVVQQVSKRNDPLETKQRGRLELPAPTVTDQELGQLAKLRASQAGGGGLVDGDPNAATQALLGDYTDRPLPTPMRTPAVGSAAASTTQESIWKQASQLRKLGQVQTPLLGTTVPKDDEREEDEEEEDKDKAALGSATPAVAPDRAGVGGQTPAVAAPRDELGLNRRFDDNASVGASTFATQTTFATLSIRELAREERRAAKRARLELEQALAALPAPQFDYELAIPTTTADDDDEANVETVETDAADIEAAELERLRKKTEQLYEARSSVVKRKDLPRPAATTTAAAAAATAEKTDEIAKEEQMIQQETATLLQHDAHAYPVISSAEKKQTKKRKKSESSAPPQVALDYVPEEYLDEAKNAIQAELLLLVEERTAATIQDEKAKNEAESLDFLIRQNSDTSRSNVSNQVFARAGWSSSKSDDDKALESLQLEFDTLQEATAAQRKKNDKAETKLTVVHGGFSKRAAKVRADAWQVFLEVQNARIEEAVYRKLQSQELTGADKRIDKLKEEMAHLETDEAVIQKKYGDLLVQKRRLGIKQKAAE